MLVLSRKKNESIVINNEITIVVVEIRGDKVRLGWKLHVRFPCTVVKFTTPSREPKPKSLRNRKNRISLLVAIRLRDNFRFCTPRTHAMLCRAAHFC